VVDFVGDINDDACSDEEEEENASTEEATATTTPTKARLEALLILIASAVWMCGLI
jgi:hypothetical protein